jgi:hypothetical protein
MELFKESVEKWQREINARRQGLGSGPVAAVGSASNSPPEKVQFYPIEVDFTSLPDETERRFFESLPTSLHLPPATVDRLRAVAARMLRQSENYRRLLHDLNPAAP